MLQMGPLVTLNPVIRGFGRGPKPHELANQISFSKSQGDFNGVLLWQFDLWYCVKFLDEFRGLFGHRFLPGQR